MCLVNALWNGVRGLYTYVIIAKLVFVKSMSCQVLQEGAPIETPTWPRNSGARRYIIDAKLVSIVNDQICTEVCTRTYVVKNRGYVNTFRRACRLESEFDLIDAKLASVTSKSCQVLSNDVRNGKIWPKIEVDLVQGCSRLEVFYT